MPLPQIYTILHFMFLLRLPAIYGGPVAKPGCPNMCGNLPISYPFGIGLNCSFDLSFTISCNTSTEPPKAYLSIIDKQLIEINETYIRVEYSNLVSVCYESEGGSYKDSSVSVNLTGTLYSLSMYTNRLTAIGCDDAVLQSNGTYNNGGCSAFCEEDINTQTGYCPFDPTSIGSGCCQSQIVGETGFVGAKLIDLSRKVQRRKLFPCSHAFIQEVSDTNESGFSYPLFYLHNSTALQTDNWASATSPPVVRLDWIAGVENCSQAKLNPTTYACQDSKSLCVDVANVSRGYQCSCLQGYEGNPYVVGGCQPIVFRSSIARNGCRDQCGELSIPFPFGIGQNCYLEPSFEVKCDTSTNPPKAYLSVLKAEITRLNSSQVRVNYPTLGFACYNWSNSQQRITKTVEQSLTIDLSKTQFTLSEDSWISVIGCDDIMVGMTGHASRTSVGSTCAAVCKNTQIANNYYAYCPTKTDEYWPGNGCCRAPIPRGTSYLEANLSEFSGRWPRTNFSCSYAFTGTKDDYHQATYPIFNNSTQIQTDDPNINYRPTIVTLDWRIGAVNCKEAQLNAADYTCQNNTVCIDFDDRVRGYLCNCSKGYQGYPYLNPGCHDIDECADSTTNTCVANSICINDAGSYHCSCLEALAYPAYNVPPNISYIMLYLDTYFKTHQWRSGWKRVFCFWIRHCLEGYVGDGREDGTRCIKLPPSKTKTIILTGMSSGLGLVLFVSVCFWLYKLLKRKREKLVKEKFFKRNGGLLLQQQTNEGSVGKTKVFPAKELEVATDHFNENRILGNGGQGTVYKGMLSDGKIVAIKKSKLVEESQLEQFINEVAILSQINHRNVVKLLGCCLETEVPLLVYEFMPNGTLYDLIHDPNNEFPFPWNMRLKVAADIAGALAYLHSASSVAIYHRDIKSSNLLLDEKYVVKVSDFGTSRSVAADQTHLTTLVQGTFGYLDPEYFQSSQFTEKSDVYSFGVVLVELLTGQTPISCDEEEEEKGLANRFLTCMVRNCLDKILDPLVLEQGRKEEVILVARVAQRCLYLKGRMRPTMKEVVTELENIKMSNMSTISEYESEDEGDFEGMPTMIPDNGYTWTGTYKNVEASSSAADPLRFTT
ncbi:wall-associated receptor kinase 2-like [Salvia hispanica]|uniref:wall-associated receptor kinase 2-like n=1 Tax=Salvia hispanica TaxID=49212 RepID=UPI002009D09A|nr:wall-associated receptor kinase 2-like [Salvia hispanica]